MAKECNTSPTEHFNLLYILTKKIKRDTRQYFYLRAFTKRKVVVSECNNSFQDHKLRQRLAQEGGSAQKV
jgi:G:T-mismatch repair DNA endonuclease (very short patch repair protein)